MEQINQKISCPLLFLYVESPNKIRGIVINLSLNRDKNFMRVLSRQNILISLDFCQKEVFFVWFIGKYTVYSFMCYFIHSLDCYYACLIDRLIFVSFRLNKLKESVLKWKKVVEFKKKRYNCVTTSQKGETMVWNNSVRIVQDVLWISIKRTQKDLVIQESPFPWLVNWINWERKHLMVIAEIIFIAMS